VYEHLCSGIEVDIVSIQRLNALARLADNRVYWSKIKDMGSKYIDRVDDLLPHYCFQSYIGIDFVQELAPMFYKKACITLEQVEDMDAFLTQDLLRVGCCPKEHLRQMADTHPPAQAMENRHSCLGPKSKTRYSTYIP
jgi:hypothetical protein